MLAYQWEKRNLNQHQCSLFYLHSNFSLTNCITRNFRRSNRQAKQTAILMGSSTDNWRFSLEVSLFEPCSCILMICKLVIRALVTGISCTRLLLLPLCNVTKIVHSAIIWIINHSMNILGMHQTWLYVLHSNLAKARFELKFIIWAYF